MECLWMRLTSNFGEDLVMWLALCALVRMHQVQVCILVQSDLVASQMPFKMRHTVIAIGGHCPTIRHSASRWYEHVIAKRSSVPPFLCCPPLPLVHKIAWPAKAFWDQLTSNWKPFKWKPPIAIIHLHVQTYNFVILPPT